MAASRASAPVPVALVRRRKSEPISIAGLSVTLGGVLRRTEVRATLAAFVARRAAVTSECISASRVYMHLAGLTR